MSSFNLTNPNTPAAFKREAVRAMDSGHGISKAEWQSLSEGLAAFRNKDVPVRTDKDGNKIESFGPRTQGGQVHDFLQNHRDPRMRSLLALFQPAGAPLPTYETAYEGPRDAGMGVGMVDMADRLDGQKDARISIPELTPQSQVAVPTNTFGNLLQVYAHSLRDDLPGVRREKIQDALQHVLLHPQSPMGATLDWPEWGMVSSWLGAEGFEASDIRKLADALGADTAARDFLLERFGRGQAIHGQRDGTTRRLAAALGLSVVPNIPGLIQVNAAGARAQLVGDQIILRGFGGVEVMSPEAFVARMREDGCGLSASINVERVSNAFARWTGVPATEPTFSGEGSVQGPRLPALENLSERERSKLGDALSVLQKTDIPIDLTANPPRPNTAATVLRTLGRLYQSRSTTHGFKMEYIDRFLSTVTQSGVLTELNLTRAGWESLSFRLGLSGYQAAQFQTLIDNVASGDASTATAMAKSFRDGQALSVQYGQARKNHASVISFRPPAAQTLIEADPPQLPLDENLRMVVQSAGGPRVFQLVGDGLIDEASGETTTIGQLLHRIQADAETIQTAVRTSLTQGPLDPSQFQNLRNRFAGLDKRVQDEILFGLLPEAGAEWDGQTALTALAALFAKDYANYQAVVDGMSFLNSFVHGTEGTRSVRALARFRRALSSVTLPKGVPGAVEAGGSLLALAAHTCAEGDLFPEAKRSLRGTALAAMFEAENHAEDIFQAFSFADRLAETLTSAQVEDTWETESRLVHRLARDLWSLPFAERARYFERLREVATDPTLTTDNPRGMARRAKLVQAFSLFEGMAKAYRPDQRSVGNDPVWARGAFDRLEDCAPEDLSRHALARMLLRSPAMTQDPELSHQDRLCAALFLVHGNDAADAASHLETHRDFFEKLKLVTGLQGTLGLTDRARLDAFRGDAKRALAPWHAILVEGAEPKDTVSTDDVMAMTDRGFLGSGMQDLMLRYLFRGSTVRPQLRQVGNAFDRKMFTWFQKIQGARDGRYFGNMVVVDSQPVAMHGSVTRRWYQMLAGSDARFLTRHLEQCTLFDAHGTPRRDGAACARVAHAISGNVFDEAPTASTRRFVAGRRDLFRALGVPDTAWHARIASAQSVELDAVNSERFASVLGTLGELVAPSSVHETRRETLQPAGFFLSAWGADRLVRELKELGTRDPETHRLLALALAHAVDESPDTEVADNAEMAIAGFPTIEDASEGEQRLGQALVETAQIMHWVRENHRGDALDMGRLDNGFSATMERWQSALGQLDASVSQWLTAQVARELDAHPVNPALRDHGAIVRLQQTAGTEVARQQVAAQRALTPAQRRRQAFDAATQREPSARTWDVQPILEFVEQRLNEARSARDEHHNEGYARTIEREAAIALQATKRLVARHNLAWPRLYDNSGITGWLTNRKASSQRSQDVVRDQRSKIGAHAISDRTLEVCSHALACWLLAPNPISEDTAEAWIAWQMALDADAEDPERAEHALRWLATYDVTKIDIEALRWADAEIEGPDVRSELAALEAARNLRLQAQTGVWSEDLKNQFAIDARAANIPERAITAFVQEARLKESGAIRVTETQFQAFLENTRGGRFERRFGKTFHFPKNGPSPDLSGQVTISHINGAELSSGGMISPLWLHHRKAVRDAESRNDKTVSMLMTGWRQGRRIQVKLQIVPDPTTVAAR